MRAFAGVDRQPGDEATARAASRRFSVIDALVGQGIDGTTVNDIRNIIVFFLSSVEDCLADGRFVPQALAALGRCEDLFDRIAARCARGPDRGLPSSMRDFLMEAQAVARLLDKGPIEGLNRDIVEAKLLVLKYLASSIDAFFFPQD